jgi:hypothetical protein
MELFPTSTAKIVASCLSLAFMVGWARLRPPLTAVTPSLLDDDVADFAVEVFIFAVVVARLGGILSSIII